MSDKLHAKAKRAEAELNADAPRLGRIGLWIAVFLLGAAAGMIAMMALAPSDNPAVYDDAAGASDPRGG